MEEEDGFGQEILGDNEEDSEPEMGDIDIEVSEKEEEESKEDEEETKEEEEEPEPKEEEEEIDGIVLDEETLVPNLSLLDSPSNLEYAYTKLMMNEAEIKDASILESYPHLRFISLAKNALRKADFLAKMTEAVYIDLNGNSIRSLPEMQPIPNLIKFDLRDNKIRALPVLPFPILTDIDLSGNQISRIENGAFKYLSSLVSLNLSGNKLKKIPEETFAGLSSLRVLRLDQNSISRFEPDAFKGLDSLQTLDLSDNQIKKTDVMITSLPQISVLNLSSNAIEDSKYVFLFKTVTSLREITLTGNPLNPEDEYRNNLIHLMPFLTKIDDEEITQEDREASEEYIENLRLEEEERRKEEEARKREEEEEQEQQEEPAEEEDEE